jgi:ATP-dependent DNA ligase
LRKELRCSSCLIDDEAIACDDNGVAVFQKLRQRRGDRYVVLCAFDLLELDGRDLRREPPQRRSAAAVVAALTQKLIQVLGQTVVSTGHISFRVGGKHLPNDTFGHFISGSSVSV